MGVVISLEREQKHRSFTEVLPCLQGLAIVLSELLCNELLVADYKHHKYIISRVWLHLHCRLSSKCFCVCMSFLKLDQAVYYSKGGDAK